MERSHRGANGQHHTTNDPDDTFDNDSSTAMSLDESSIQLNATAAPHNISVDMTGTSFSRRGGGSYGGGRRSNASARHAQDNDYTLVVVETRHKRGKDK